MTGDDKMDAGDEKLLPDFVASRHFCGNCGARMYLSYGVYWTSQTPADVMEAQLCDLCQA